MAGIAPGFVVYYDSLQEGQWFKNLHPALASATMKRISAQLQNLAPVLKYDRPDIILADGDKPILVLERTKEVPSGHNVGQRFGRLVAAAETQVPAVFFGPYAAFKHGGATRGPRYMNLRLFCGLDALERVYDTSAVSICWPADSNYELISGPQKDQRVRDYLNLFFEHYLAHGPQGLNKAIRVSQFQAEQLKERARFIKDEVRNPQQYDSPPDSVVILKTEAAKLVPPGVVDSPEVVLYKVGMNYVRSDPYTGSAMLYKLLYIQAEKANRALVLHFPGITISTWKTAALSNRRKDVRIFRDVADAVVFRDGCLSRAQL